MGLTIRVRVFLLGQEGYLVNFNTHESEALIAPSGLPHSAVETSPHTDLPMHFNSDLQHPFNSSNESIASLEKDLSIVPISAKACDVCQCRQLPTGGSPKATKLSSEPGLLEVKSLHNKPAHHFMRSLSYKSHVKSKRNKLGFNVQFKT